MKKMDGIRGFQTMQQIHETDGEDGMGSSERSSNN